MQKHQIIYRNIVEMNLMTHSESLNFKSSNKDNNSNNNAGISYVKIIVPLNYVSYFWRTLEMPLINYEVTLDVDCSQICVTFEVDRVTKFAMASAKLYVPAVTLSSQDNGKLLQELTSGFITTINWNKYQ